MDNKLVLIDGHSILNRAFYGVPDLTNAEGLHTNAVYGFLNIMFKILDTEKPEYLTVAFDVKKPTFRHEMFKEYKGTRKPMPEELRQQVPVIQDVLEAMGITIVKRQNLTSGNTQSCGCIISKGEARIKRILQEANIPFISQWTPQDYPNQKCKFDFYIDNKYVVEFDGPQHEGQVSGYYTKEKVDALMQRDQEKNQYCLSHNIPLYRIPYEYRDKLTLALLTDERFLVKS